MDHEMPKLDAAAEMHDPNAVDFFDHEEEEAMLDPQKRTRVSSESTSSDNPDQNDRDSDTNHMNDTTSNNDHKFDDMTREAGLILDEKLQGVRGWCKKLLHEITIYNQVCAEAQVEYRRIQDLEHQESNRLDQVEPDVKGATSHLLEQQSFYKQ
jgi:hypothetical protein